MGNQPSTQQQQQGTTPTASWVRSWSGGSDQAGSDESLSGRELKSSFVSSQTTTTSTVTSESSSISVAATTVTSTISNILRGSNKSADEASNEQLVSRTEIMSNWLQKQTIQRVTPPKQPPTPNSSTTSIPSTATSSQPIGVSKDPLSDNNNYDFDLSSSPKSSSLSSSSFSTTPPSSSTGLLSSVLKPRVYNNSAWKNRFFVLSRGIIYYYTVKSEEVFRNVEKTVCKCASRIPQRLQGLNKVGYSYTLYWPARGSQAPLQMATSTEEELESWLNFWEQYAANNSMEKSGWMYIWNNIYRKWSLRYLYVKGDVLEFTQRDEKGVFPLAGTRVEIPDFAVNSSTGFIFTIYDNSRVLNLSAESEEIRSAWMEALNNEILYLEQTNLNLSDRISIELANKVNDSLAKHQLYVQAKAKQIEEQEKNGLLDTSRKSDKCFILSIDGGGMRGIITTILLSRIVEKYPDFTSKIDLVAGCSNGGMVAMALAFGFEPKFCHLLLELTGDTIFKTSMLSNALNSAKFRNTQLKLLCDLIWNEKKLKDASTKVMIPAFLLDNHHSEKRSCETRIFHNVSSTKKTNNTNNNNTSEKKIDDTSDPHSITVTGAGASTELTGEEELASDVVMRTISAPTYFPSYQQYIDGGVFCHDPASQALSLVLSPTRMNKRPSEVCMLSFGTGRVLRYYEDANHDWGYYQWLPRLPNCFWDGMLGKSEMICRELLGDAYCRLDPLLPKEMPMDNPLIIPELTELAKNVDLSHVFQWIEEHVYGTAALSSNDTQESQQ